MLLASGWAAVHVAMFDDGDGIWYPDMQQTGIGRYRTREEAENEARDWSRSDKIPLARIG